MRSRLLLITIIASAAFAACSSGSGNGYGSKSPTSTAAKTTKGDVAVAGTSLGETVVDGSGRTLYTYSPDGVGKSASACTGSCASLWPAVTVTGAPEAGSTKLKVSTITRDDTKQLVVNGRPVYLYSGDGAPGDVNGQAIGKVWFALDADGNQIGAST